MTGWIDQIDWNSFLSRQDPLWDTPPTAWADAPFLGNGLLGCYLMCRGKDMLLELGRTDVCDHRQDEDTSLYSRRRLPIGHMRFSLREEITGADLRLDLHRAELTGHIRTVRGDVSIRILVHSLQPVILCELQPSQGSLLSGMRFVPQDTKCPERIYSRIKEVAPDPPAYAFHERGFLGAVQPLLAGGEYATAWRQISEEEGGCRLLIATSSVTAAGGGIQEAERAIDAAEAQVWQALLASHREWWAAFYRKSFVSIPDDRLESLYWIQMYKLGSATRAEHPAIDLMGPWYLDSAWLIIWWNLNIQLSYFPVYAANHLELGESFCRLLHRNQQNLALNVPEAFREDCYAIGRTTGYDCLNEDMVGKEYCNLPWACHNYWMQYRHSMDDRMLREELYPLLKRSTNFYLRNLREDSQGILHAPFSYSPEYPVGAEDCNVDLALIRWGCDTLLQICDRLKIKDPQQAQWRDVLQRLADYPKDETGLLIGRDVPLSESHRHYSHLFPIYPLYLMHWEQPQMRPLIETSLAHWLSMEEALQGYSYTGAASMLASMGRGEEAVRSLDALIEGYLLPNTMYREELGPVIETPLSAARSIQDMLMTSWGGCIRIFPGIPEAWGDVVFHDLRAEGAFLVSAVREGGELIFVRVRSLAGEPLRMRFSMAAPWAQVGGAKAPLVPDAEGIYSIPLARGEELLIHPQGVSGPFVLRDIGAAKDAVHWFGGRKGRKVSPKMKNGAFSADD